MRIVYSASTCSQKVYTRLFSHCEFKPAYHSQKYHRLLIEGLAAHTRVDVVAAPPVNRDSMERAFVRLDPDTEGGAYYHYIPAIRNPYIKLAFVGVGTFLRTLFLIRKDSAVIVDCLNRTVSLAALLAAKLRGCRCVSIVTDIPDLMNCGSGARKVSNFIIRHSTDYVLLTQAMNEYLQNTTKPYVVLEGHADISMKECEPSQNKKLTPRVCMYAGCISKQYGLGDLVDAFRKADIPGVQLHLYGPCDYPEELKQIAAEDSRIVYGGMLLNSEIVDKEMEATLLVNPRPTHEEFVKYSFPSKTMEYMSTGTPVLTTKLPGMPAEYYPYVYFIEQENTQGIMQALQQTLALPDSELYEKGCRARNFVLETRNNVVQASRILEMLNQ